MEIGTEENLNIGIYASHVKSQFNENPTGDQNLDLLHATIGLSEEIGEILGEYKKNVFHNKPQNTYLLLEEFGDAFWYFISIMNLHGYDLSYYVENTTNSRINITEYHNRIHFNLSKDPLLDQLLSVKKLYSATARVSESIDKYDYNFNLEFFFRQYINCAYKAGFELKDIILNNIEKLKIRYPHGRTKTYINIK